MRTTLMATVAASLVLTSTAANAGDHRQHTNVGGVVAGLVGLGLLGYAFEKLDDGHHRSYYDDDGGYYRGGRGYHSYAPGRPRVHCTEWYDTWGHYRQQCRTYYNGQRPQYAEPEYAEPRVAYEEQYQEEENEGPPARSFVSRDPPQLPGFYVDPTTRTTPCGFDLKRCMKNGR